jgi:nitrite reductase/ring-hydroxylating ferredoxin subunit
MAANGAQSTEAPYSGYYHRDVMDPDLALTQVGPGTPGGEYLRRFWHPVGKSSELLDLPRRIRIIGEDLVLFRDGQGAVGLLALHCAHRGTSLEYGMVERHGIRCCYHGWLYGVDGRVLETPGEPADSTLKDRFYHGAYPTHEYKGLVFAYMGPPHRRPEFPIFDTFELPGYRLVPTGGFDERNIYTCNWLQIKENAMDPLHRLYLHDLEEARAALARYRPSASGASLDTWLEDGLDYWEREVAAVSSDIRVMEWQETATGMIYIYTRRLGEMVWVRISDFIPPNIHQFGVQDEATDEVVMQRPAMTHWTVPIDDTHTTVFGFRHAAEVQERRLRDTRPGLRGSDSLDRPYEVRQREPGDYEAQESQRPIAVHALEHLGSGDRGIIMVRKLIRDGIQAVHQGGDPRRPSMRPGELIPTHSQNTILRVPRRDDPDEERELLRRTGRRVAAGQVHA